MKENISVTWVFGNGLATISAVLQYTTDNYDAEQGTGAIIGTYTVSSERPLGSATTDIYTEMVEELKIARSQIKTTVENNIAKVEEVTGFSNPIDIVNDVKTKLESA